MEPTVTLTKGQIARIFQQWNADCVAEDRPLTPHDQVDHHAQAEEFVTYADKLANEL